MVPITPSDGLKKVFCSDSWECMLLQLQKSLIFQCQTSARKNETCRCVRGISGRTVNSKKESDCCRQNNLTGNWSSQHATFYIFISRILLQWWCSFCWIWKGVKETKLWNKGFHLHLLWSIQNSVHWCSQYKPWP